MVTLKVEGEITEAGIDAEVVAFDAAFQKFGNPALNKFERAIIKTYLIWKLKYAHEPVVPAT